MRWSARYKRKINCKRPRGFSQVAHCKHKHKQLALAKTKRRQTTTEIGETELRCTER